MSDPLDEIISMSNDETISKKQIEDSDDSDDDSDDEKEKEKEKEKTKITESEKKKKKKINKKQLSKDLQKNKIREIKIAMPYTINTESSNTVVDYNKSEEIIPKNKHISKRKEIPFYEKRWFKILTIILVTIACSLLVMFVSIKVYKHIEYTIKIDPLTDTLNDKKSNDDRDEQTTSKFDNDIIKDFKKLATNINGGKVNNKKKQLPKRDSKGRFVKQNK